MRWVLKGVGEVILYEVFVIINLEEFMGSILEFGLLICQIPHQLFCLFSLLDEINAFIGVVLNHVVEIFFHHGLLVEREIICKCNMLHFLCWWILLHALSRLLALVNVKRTNLRLNDWEWIFLVIKILLCGRCRVLTTLRFTLWIVARMGSPPLVILKVQNGGNAALNAGQSSVKFVLVLSEQIGIFVILCFQKFEDQSLCFSEWVLEFVIKSLNNFIGIDKIFNHFSLSWCQRYLEPCVNSSSWILLLRIFWWRIFTHTK